MQDMQEIDDTTAFVVVRDLDDNETREIVRRVETFARCARGVTQALPYIMFVTAVAYWILVTETRASIRVLIEVCGAAGIVCAIMYKIVSWMLNTSEKAAIMLEQDIDPSKLVKVPELLVVLWNQTAQPAFLLNDELEIVEAFLHPFARRSLIKLVDDFWSLIEQGADEAEWNNFCIRAYADIPFCRWPNSL